MLDFPASPSDGQVFQPSTAAAGWIAKSGRWRRRGWQQIDKRPPTNTPGPNSDLVIILPSQYEVFLFTAQGIRPAVNNQHIQLYISTDNFSTYLSDLNVSANFSRADQTGGNASTLVTPISPLNVFPAGPDNTVYAPNNVRMLIFNDAAGGAILFQNECVSSPSSAFGPMTYRGCISTSARGVRWTGFVLANAANIQGHGGWELLGLAA